MPCKFFRNWLAISFLIVTPLSAQPLDWYFDVVCFGTDQHEWSPQIVSLPGGGLRAFCLRGQSQLSSRMSITDGETWLTFYDRDASNDSTQMAAESDMSSSYLLDWRRGGREITLHRMSLSTSDWPELPLRWTLPDSLSLLAVDITTDAVIWPDDNFLYLGYLASSSSGGVLGFARSESHGEDWVFETTIASGIPITDSASVISIAVSWTDEWLQYLTIAVERDRGGSIGEEIVLFRSEDYGMTWDNGRAIDSSSYIQQHPSLIARGDTVLCAYSRRNGASVARDVFYSFTLEAGGEWAVPEALTESFLDNHHPKLASSSASGLYGLFYLSNGVQNEHGTLHSRTAPATEPWIWSEESLVSDGQTAYVREGWDVCAHENGFAAVWSSRIVGDDGDVMFDASWRHVAVGPQPAVTAAKFAVFPNPTQGELVVQGLGSRGEVVLYDLLGRRVAVYDVKGKQRISLPRALPQGMYYLKSETGRDVQRVMLIR